MEVMKLGTRLDWKEMRVEALKGRQPMHKGGRFLGKAGGCRGDGGVRWCERAA
jgi:hypothetical protein